MAKKLRIVLLYSTGHLGSAIVLNMLEQVKDIEIAGIVRATPIKNKAVKEQLKKLGWRFSWLLLWQQFIQAVAYGLALLLRPWLWKKSFLPGWYLAKKHGIPVFHCKGSVNGPGSESFIRACAPDVIISAFFNRILKKNIIVLPKTGILNVHPGWLPHYKGAMSYFWTLKNNEPYGGVTLHWINEGIDTGDIIAQRRFRLHRHSTQHQALLKAAVIGATLIRKSLEKISAGQSLPAIAQAEGAGAYYAMPTAEAFDDYFLHRRFFRIRDVFSHVLRGIMHLFIKK
jgi:folate-dependent phosphoribosylglycinamide formyltransferase PurN